jgi:aspartyl-tRNA(Asn)/glutamyl-tRNA(Gln) amidotransferase subunit A
MAEDDLAFRSLEELSGLLAVRETSSADLVELFLARAGRLDAKLHAYAQLFEDAARAAAGAADAARASGRPVGALHGVPIAIKDLFDYAGMPTHAGSNALAGRHPARSANAVRRLQAAGMIVLGKTHMVEFAFGGWGTNPVQGAPWNPWNLDEHHAPGGSSSGSAVAVAAGLAPAALGTDTGGSVRTPATWCGLVGLKTSLGLIGRGGVVPLCPTHDTVGPLVRSVRDAALLLDALTGADGEDPATAAAPAVAPLAEIERGISGFRLGVLGAEDLVQVAPSIRDLFAQALGDLEALGARIEEVRLPLSIGAYLAGGGDIMSAESYEHLGRYVEPAEGVVDAVIRARIMRGKDISRAAYAALLEARRAAQTEFLVRLEGLDALVVPGCHRAAPPLSTVDETAPPNIFGRFVNFLDLASLAVPIGLTGEGLPAGMQIVVRRFEDAVALRIGRAFEQARGGVVRRPPGL